MSSLYTRARLATLAPTASSQDDLLALLGLEATPQRRIYLRRKLTEFDIPTDHFPQPAVVHTRELLQEGVDHAESFAGVVRHLGLRPAGGTQAYIARRIREFGIDTSHFTGQAHNRGKRLKGRSVDFLVQRPATAKRVPGQRLRLALIESGRPDACALCGNTGTWLGKPITLEVDHINGDWSDNRAENLRMLCPNCHTQTETYCGRNKNRRSRQPPSGAARTCTASAAIG
ncbi:HNH endonuclease [Streptacidiphilus sp. PB12-B1b]|uniref:HNH endonuclease signature motif containing protein n=1 Tax=Streptacidiphilus sp. PB12-B1b TaxID=2705012 RepID=UPI0015F813B9|nr:HNH endonuclease signature motif containing protein [Streptacidiphilus sp. PB12-B1b]QMU75373.1 HNH endonuclease [Streptacidiphilus sp. PB12-B1b]